MATVGEMVCGPVGSAPRYKGEHGLVARLRELGIWDAEVLEGCAWHDSVRFTGRMLDIPEAGQRVRVIVLPCPEKEE